MTATLLSLAALIVSIASGFATYRSSQKQNDLQERLLALEATRQKAAIRQSRQARLSARFDRIGHDWMLGFRNDGKSGASEIRITIDDQSVLEHPLVLHGSGEITELGSGAEAHSLIAPSMGMPDVYTVELTWRDDSGEPGKWRSQLHV